MRDDFYKTKHTEYTHDVIILRELFLYMRIFVGRIWETSFLN